MSTADWILIKFSNWKSKRKSCAIICFVAWHVHESMTSHQIHFIIYTKNSRKQKCGSGNCRRTACAHYTQNPSLNVSIDAFSCLFFLSSVILLNSFILFLCVFRSCFFFQQRTAWNFVLVSASIGRLNKIYTFILGCSCILHSSNGSICISSMLLRWQWLQRLEWHRHTDIGRFGGSAICPPSRQPITGNRHKIGFECCLRDTCAMMRDMRLYMRSKIFVYDKNNKCGTFLPASKPDGQSKPKRQLKYQNWRYHRHKIVCTNLLLLAILEYHFVVYNMKFFYF